MQWPTNAVDAIITFLWKCISTFTLKAIGDLTKWHFVLIVSTVIGTLLMCGINCHESCNETVMKLLV